MKFKQWYRKQLFKVISKIIAKLFAIEVKLYASYNTDEFVKLLKINKQE